MAEIPLPSGSDIYSLGFDKGLNRGIPDNSTGVVYDTIENALNTGSVLSGGNLNLKTLSIGGLVRQVAPGDDIQAAIDAVNREGGGTVQLLAKTYNPTSDIRLRSNVRLAGAGIGVTIIDFMSGGWEVRSGDSNDTVNRDSSFKIENLTIQNGALDILYSDDFVVEDVLVTSSDGIGVRVRGCRRFLMKNVQSTSHLAAGFHLNADGNLGSLGGVDTFSLIDCVASNNGGGGIVLSRTAGGSQVGVLRFEILNARTTDNAGDGIEFAGAISTANGFGRFIGIYSDTNGGFDFQIDQGAYMSFVGCYFSDFSISTSGNVISSCTSPSTSPFTDTSTGGNLYIGNTGPGGSTTGSAFTTFDEDMHGYGNDGTAPTEQREFIHVKNTSGAVLPSGAVVILKSVAGGNEVTTTTTNGDNKVIGMSRGANNNAFHSVLIQGKTALLYANNSAASIAIGDWLSTYSHAYYAKKAVAGDTVFAMALEAPTTGTAQIDALLVSPRLI